MLVVIACAVLYKCMSDEHYAVVAITLVVVVVGRIRGMIEIEGSRGGERFENGRALPTRSHALCVCRGGQIGE